MAKLTGWKTIGAEIADGQIVSLLSAFTKEREPFSGTMRDPKGIYVGTNKEFCLDYYTGLFDEEEVNATEILLKVELDSKDLVEKDMTERWRWPCGTEAVARKVQVVAWAETSKLMDARAAGREITDDMLTPLRQAGMPAPVAVDGLARSESKTLT